MPQAIIKTKTGRSTGIRQIRLKGRGHTTEEEKYFIMIVGFIPQKSYKISKVELHLVT